MIPVPLERERERERKGEKEEGRVYRLSGVMELWSESEENLRVMRRCFVQTSKSKKESDDECR